MESLVLGLGTLEIMSGDQKYVINNSNTILTIN